jgi:hypothetical protein
MSHRDKKTRSSLRADKGIWKEFDPSVIPVKDYLSSRSKHVNDPSEYFPYCFIRWMMLSCSNEPLLKLNKKSRKFGTDPDRRACCKIFQVLGLIFYFNSGEGNCW